MATPKKSVLITGGAGLIGRILVDRLPAHYALSGSRSLTAGDAITMVSQNGKVLASPVRLTDFTFKAVFEAAG
jgi:nucleoside-diphosphate-sugar epimerase